MKDIKKDLANPRVQSLVLKTTILVLGVLGQILTLGRSSFMSGEHFFYYTNISNLLVILVTIALLLIEGKALRETGTAVTSSLLGGLQFIAASGILLTFTGFTLLLAPLMSPSYLFSVDNLLVHTLVPLLACADFILFYKGKANQLNRSLGLLLPLCYLVLFAVLALSGHRFHQGVAPYFFMDYEKNGWLSAGEGRLGVVYWFLILLALQLFLSHILLGLRKARERQ